MKITLKRQKKESKSIAYSSADFDGWLDSVGSGKYELYGSMYRAEAVNMIMPELWRYYGRLFHVMVAAKYTKNSHGEVVFRSYNGIVPMRVVGLSEQDELDRVKREAMLLPQTLAAITGLDGHSVIILVRATLPQGEMPQGETDAELFHVKAYRTAVQCYAPTLSRPILVENPTLDMSFLAPYDAEMKRNPRAVPFIIEQPTALEVERLVDARTPSNVMREKQAGWAGISLRQIFNACYIRVRQSMTKEDWLDPNAAVVQLAHACAETGIPEEVATRELLFHYYKEDHQDVRSTVRAVYEGYDPLPGLSPGMPKKQVATLRLQEFLGRRYELRHNEVTNQLEYRVRNGFDFEFHELTKYDRNTIMHEAALEGIEAFDAEINGYIESNYTPHYNPIEDYIDNLSAWDGKDRIDALAGLVPTNNPNWKRLFRRWFLGMVAHWVKRDEEHGNNTAPILIGKQGYRKSTFCRILLPPELRGFFADSIDFRTKQEAERYLTRFLLINIDEFDQLSEAQFAFVKHLFQKPVVSMRRMYSEAISQQRRYASFIGTSNRQEVLRDPTGNRRYLCVEVTAPIRTETPIEYGQLYAQAVQLIRMGERYWLDDADEALLRESNKYFETMSPLDMILLDTFEPAKEGDEGAELMKLPRIMEVLKGHKLFIRSKMEDVTHLGRSLTKAGFKSKRKHDGVYYWVRKL